METKEIVMALKFIGFALARLEKAKWKKSEDKEKVEACPYKWTVYTKMGTSHEKESKIDDFWAFLSISRGSPLRKGITSGPYGFILRQGASKWEAVPTKMEYDCLVSEWNRRLDEV